jgi:hypothetical protein
LSSTLKLYENPVHLSCPPRQRIHRLRETQHQQPFYGNSSNWKVWGYSIRTTNRRNTEWQTIGDDRIVARELYDHVIDPAETMNLADEREREADELGNQLATQFPKAAKK